MVSMTLSPYACTINWLYDYCTITFTIHCLYTYYAITIHSLYIHNTLTIHLLYVHYAFAIHSLYIYYTFTIPLLCIHYRRRRRQWYGFASHKHEMAWNPMPQTAMGVHPNGPRAEGARGARRGGGGALRSNKGVFFRMWSRASQRNSKR